MLPASLEAARARGRRAMVVLIAFLPGLLGVAEGQLNARNWVRSPGAETVTKSPLFGALEARRTIPVSELSGRGKKVSLAEGLGPGR